MKTEIYYFTGTGNGLHIAKSIKDSLVHSDEKVELIPMNTLDLSQELYSNANRVGIIFPTYSMSSPAIVQRFAKKLRTSSGAYVFTYAHCGGGGAGGASASIVDILSDNNIVVSNAYQTTFPSNSTLFKYTDEKIKSVLSKSEVSVEKNVKAIINNEIKIKSKSNPLARVSRKLNEAPFVALEHHLKFKVIEANENCNGCSICSKVCPMDNIKMNGKPDFKSNCETCFSCIHNCPQKALGFKKMNRKNFKPYRHPDVKVKELMYR